MSFGVIMDHGTGQYPLRGGFCAFLFYGLPGLGQ